MASYSDPDHGLGAVWGQANQFMQPIPIYPQEPQLFDAAGDVWRAEAHLPDLPALTARLEKAAKETERLVQSGWNTRHDSYKNVSVLLLSWTEDDAGVEFEINSLRSLFEDNFHYNVHVTKIHSGQDVYADMINALDVFTKQYGGEETLLIIYYIGHGTRGISGPIWAPRAWPDYTRKPVELEAAGLFPILSAQDGDVLLIFDCCSALPLQLTSNGKGVISSLSATGFEAGKAGWAPSPGSTSFTRALVKVLAEKANEHNYSWNVPFISDVQLHAALVTKLAHQAPSPRADQRGNLEQRPDSPIMYESKSRTPHYQFLSVNKDPKAICFKPKTSLSNNSHAISRPMDNTLVPQVLLKIQLHDSTFDVEAWAKWIRSCPSTAQHVSIEGVYGSTSTIQILRLPLDLWDLLPRDPAITFLGFVTSENQAPRINAEISARVSELQAKENPTTPDKRAHDPEEADDKKVPEEADDGNVFVQDTPESADRKGKGVMPPFARTPNGSCLPRLSLTPPDMADRLSPRPTPRRSGSRDSQGHESTGSSSMSSTLARLAIRGRQNKKTSPKGTDRKR